MTKILLARHGESEFNNTHRFAGIVDIELTDTGRRQAERLRDRLAGEKIDVVYTSNLKRARRTAEIVITGRDLGITECPELNEISYGEIEGLTFNEIRQRYPTLADQIRRSDLNMDFPGGENFLDFIKRVESFKEHLVKHSDSESVLIVAHGGPLRTLLCSLLGISQESWWQLRIDNASLSIVETYPIESNVKPEPADKTKELPRRAILSLFNETSYLVEETERRSPPLSTLRQQPVEIGTTTTKNNLPGEIHELSIRLLKQPDIPVIYSAFSNAGWHRTPGMLEEYLAEQEKGERFVCLAFSGKDFAGYVTIKWQVTDYIPFAEKGIPEITDLNVLPPFQKHRIATKLLDEAERRIFERSPIAGIGVGLFADYGAAQRMYIRRGYVPDGMGIAYKGQPVKPYSSVRIDDELTLYLVKEKMKEN